MKSDFELSNFVIQSPYTITLADKKAIEKASNGNPQKEDWEKSTLKDFKGRVRQHYRDQQNDRCAYCRMDISSATGSFHIEHIIPKSLHPEWMYNPKNLCVACSNCNSAKYNDNVLSSDKYTNLPSHSSDYLIVHPHLDNYFEHIQIVDGLLYKGLTKKGKFTIKTCNLTRVGLLTERAKLLITKEQPPFSYSQIFITCTMNPQCIGNLDELLEEIHKLLKRYGV